MSTEENNADRPPAASGESIPPTNPVNPPAPPLKTAHWYRRLPRWVYKAAAVGAVSAVAIGVEVHTSFLQSRLFTSMAEGKTFTETQQSSPTVQPPAAGPYDERLGYTQELLFRARLSERGYEVAQETQWQERKIAGLQLFPIYNEKAQAGLRLVDENGHALFDARFPRQTYPDYASIPPVIVQSLLFVEDRQLLDNQPSTHNNAVNWGRFAKAARDRVRMKLHLGGSSAGGSTLATQTEKFRHSPRGVTGSSSEKLEQMLTASVRNYQDGTDTRQSRERIVLDYLNSMPLSSFPGAGEIIGFGDGMSAWFGADFNETNRLLRKPEAQMNDGELKQAADAYRQALRLVMSVTKPSAYLLKDRAELDARVDAYLPLLVEHGIITPRMKDAVKAAHPGYATRAPQPRNDNTDARQKSIEGLQINLMKDLGVKDIYALNRLDITARTTVDAQADQAVANILRSLSDPAVAQANGLTGHQLLNPALADQLRYSFTLYEKRSDGTNVLRVQADNFDGALNINEGTKLELGSTAKLRTLVSYLEAMAELHGKYGKMDEATLRAQQVQKDDNLSRWAIDYLADPVTDKSLNAMLEASLERTYSGNPGERFFTGGGVHTFENFEPSENYKAYNVKDAFHHSVNLSFIRMMRDVVYYTQSQKMDVSADIYENPDNPLRRKYLEQFIHAEGTTFLWKAWSEQKDKTPEQTLELLAGKTTPTPAHLAVIYRSVMPNAPLAKMEGFIRAHCANCGDATDFQKLYDDYAPGKFDLNDRGYITGVHPLALWLAQHRAAQPAGGWSDAVAASSDARIEVYKWLLKPDKIEAQNTRIRTMLEKEAFVHIHATWKHLGYAFDRMVPSYASALGSSGDTPAALATLSGILQNDGVLRPAIKFDEISFAENTPYALDFLPKKSQGTRVLPEEVARLARREMNGVVEEGTARRANKSVVLSDGQVLSVGGKTGTGDNRQQTFSKGGGVTSSEAKSRTATFVFAIGDRFYGTVVAYVDGPDAGKHRFTSALAAQVFKSAIPAIRPVLDKAYGVDPAQVAAAQPVGPASISPKVPKPKGTL
ncbi:MAG TPA: transglycosylase domain-containing protein [Patescibacteria group bacterium]|nr:transglycosylase domain-containing protein [Patescibacteria group bacterium]